MGPAATRYNYSYWLDGAGKFLSEVLLLLQDGLLMWRSDYMVLRGQL